MWRGNTQKLEAKIKETGKSDLDALNKPTRKKKKAKEERKKERDEKRDTKFGGNKTGQPGNATNRNNNGAQHPGGGPGAHANKPAGSTDEKKKRNRIKKDRVDINNTPGTNARPSTPRPNNTNQPAHRDERRSRLKNPVHADIHEADVHTKINETRPR